ncbi:MAG: 2-amino-4-hydroxy-6-hydroxymethyldihydropteridine diphosphokinase [Pseudomonadales bacterium]|nr:2-amino-4-hydroxy-6-hydroxymethyldihydropteridine diphosphokinase [Pseudomonadales bacterium]MDP7360672.1 2-amino-4-hydroxy-6-hydroxymethyldihydropteridine diphosphokinase [Pseudomonadales bacterium]MDP7597987.1 2-amino-4-hydroxy-6-hydroxymethyldihydropteridine diphosphokinase [Pseudomonadales bacterium]HJN52634.1 2-amino-4-hydroxy-6-hydroxymethyldihydropteridine diphosphokinase [Pseudomonadales bacterium]
MTPADNGHDVYVSVGSNIERHRHVSKALDALNERYTVLAISSVYESASIGFAGEPFFNLVVQFGTTESLIDLVRSLRMIEEENGRNRREPKFSDRTLDIDILLYDDRVGDFEKIRLPRPEITENAYVLWPLAEIACDLKLPGSHRRFGDLWSAYDKTKQQLTPIRFSWQGNVLPMVSMGHPDRGKGSPDE